MRAYIERMNIGYGINRRVSDFAKAGIDLDGFDEPRVWIDTDKKVRPEFSSLLMSLQPGDTVHVLAMSDLGRGGFGQGEAVRKIEAQGATVSVIDAEAPPEPRKPGPKPRWPIIPESVVRDGASKWHNPDIFTFGAALAVFHEAGFPWVTRATLNDNLGPRSAPKPKEGRSDG